MEPLGQEECAARSRGALRHAAAGVACLVAGLGLGALARSDGMRILLVIAGFLALVEFVRRALVLWKVDSVIFEKASGRRCVLDRPGMLLRSPSSRRRVGGALRLVGLAGVSLLSAAAIRGQQTVFNVPTADILDRGKLYLETDWLWRPSDSRFASGEVRGVYGVGKNVEIGVNLAGFVPDGSSAVVGIPNVKWQPYRSEALSLTTGALLLLHLNGPEDRRPTSMGYAQSAVRLPIGTRVTAGGWLAASRYAGLGVERGGLFALEQPLSPHLTLAADWYTGKSGLGYLSLGLIVAAGRWVLYASYAFKNGDSKSSGLLLEMGFTP